MTDVELWIVRSCGLLGVIGSLTIMVTDWMGWTKAIDDKDKSVDLTGLQSPLISMLTKSGYGIGSDRRQLASIIGGHAMLPCAMGFVPVYFLLAPGSQLLAALAALTGAGSLVYGTMAHAMYGYVDEIKYQRAKAQPGSETHEVLTELTQRAINYWTPFGLSSIAVMGTLSAAVYSIAVVLFDTALPKWMALYNLALVMFVCRNAHRFLPFSLSRWIGPANVHLFAHAPFLALCTYFAWNGV